MVKIGLLLVLALAYVSAQTSQSFQEKCIQCHKKEGIPTEALYKRYLIKYSSQTKIKALMFKYLKNPSIETSIMPKPFIHKFGLQEKISLSDEELKKYVDELVESYDIKHKLYIPTP